MEKHLLQAEHNKKFLTILIKDYPNQFYDWKVTVIFYTAIHLVKAFAILNHVDLGDTHEQIFSKISPRNDKKPPGFKDWMCGSYSTLFRNSQNARYDGFISESDHEEMYAEYFTHSYQKLISLESFILKKIKEEESKQANVVNSK